MFNQHLAAEERENEKICRKQFKLSTNKLKLSMLCVTDWTICLRALF